MDDNVLSAVESQVANTGQADQAGEIPPNPATTVGGSPEKIPPAGRNQQLWPNGTPSLSGARRMNIDVLMDLPVQVTVELGRSRMTVQQVLDLEQGSVVELDSTTGEAVNVYVNDRLIARGEVVVVDDNFGVRIIELVSAAPVTGGG
jgi:flagellar motor switch protein FliN/FliY